MENKRLPVSLGNFSLIDSNLPRMRHRFSEEMIRMDNEMNRLMSRMPQLAGFGVSDKDSSLVIDDGNKKSLQFTFDVSQYDPNEVTVETVDDKIMVHAKHEEKSNNKSVFMEYRRAMSLPPGTDPASIDINISDDGVLIAKVPFVGQVGSQGKPAIRN